MKQSYIYGKHGVSEGVSTVNVHSPEEAIETCRRHYTSGVKLIQTGRDKNKSDIVKHGVAIIDIVNSWRYSIKARHVFKDLMKYSLPFSIKDYEAHAELLKYSLELLSSVLSEKDVEAIINNYDDYIKSLYYFNRASTNRLFKGVLSIDSYINDLDKAIEYAPENPVPHYYKALWLIHYILALTPQLGGASDSKICSLVREALREVERAINMDNKWVEALELKKI